MAGQVDGNERAAQGQCHRVPRVSVLAAAVEEDQLGIADPPHQRAQPAVIWQVDEFAPDSRRAWVGQTVLFGVLVKQPELVVVDTFNLAHCASLESRRVVLPSEASTMRPWSNG